MKKISNRIKVLSISCSIVFLFSANMVFGQRYIDRGQTQKEEKRKQEDNPDSLSAKSFLDRLTYGGNFSLDIGNPTYIDISPIIGYRATPKWQVGVGATYIYYNSLIDYGNGLVYRLTGTIYGGRVYTQYDVLHDIFRPNDKLYLHGEYEFLNVPTVNNLGQNSRQWIEDPYVGGGFRSPIGNRGYINLSLLYNVDYARYQAVSPYGSPFQIRIGFTL